MALFGTKASPFVIAAVSFVLGVVTCVVILTPGSSVSLVSAPSTISSLTPPTVCPMSASGFPVDHLISAIRASAPADVVERCVQIVQGGPGSMFASFAQGYQDWLLFHNYFRHLQYGEGFYVDVGSNHPKEISNSYFFDVCLGWKGLCVEPNSMYHPLYPQFNRTCTIVPNCVMDREIQMSMSPGEQTLGHMRSDEELAKEVSKGANGSAYETVTCRPLADILLQHKATTVDFISLDVEGAEATALYFFPFRDFDISTWVVETNKAGSDLFRVFLRGGYTTVADVLVPFKHATWAHLGGTLDSIFRRMYSSGRDAASVAPWGPFVYGPDWLPGGPLAGKGPRPACRLTNTTAAGGDGECREQVPTLNAGDVGADQALKHECSRTDL